MTGDPTDRTIRELRDLAKEAAASVRSLDLAEHEAALAREAEAEIARLAREAGAPTQKGIDWQRIKAMAERHRR